MYKEILVKHNYIDKYGYEWDVHLYEKLPLNDVNFTDGQTFDGGVTYSVVNEDGVIVGGAQCKRGEKA